MFKRMSSFSAAAVLSAVPMLAGAQSTAYSTSPVSIASCNLDESYATAYWFAEGPQQFASTSIALSFVNKTNISATTVTFVLNDGRQTHHLRDEGTFAPDVRIDRRFTIDTGTSVRQPATCSVAEVTFADGNVWRAEARDIARR